jgi:ring-1,2-phenylacetyl-CoA epoxidase subunit PaaC
MTDDTNVLPFPSPITTATEEARAEAARQGVELLTPSPAFDVQPTLDLPQAGAAPALPAWATDLTARAATDEEAALAVLLLSAADDEFVLGYRNSEWTGIAPMLEDDVAFSSMAQDEIGHARLLYEILGTRLGVSADAVAYGRPPEAFRNAHLLERPRTNWAFTIMRQYLYDQFDHVRLEALAESSLVPLAQATAKILREEKYHLMYGETWMHRLTEGGADSEARLAQALTLAWPDALGLFEPLPGEALLVQAGYLPITMAALQGRWRERLDADPFLAQLASQLPDVAPAAPGGRQGAHTEAFAPLYEELTVVYRIDPQASW